LSNTNDELSQIKILNITLPTIKVPHKVDFVTLNCYTICVIPGGLHQILLATQTKSNQVLRLEEKSIFYPTLELESKQTSENPKKKYVLIKGV